MMFLIVLGCAANVDCGQQKDFRGSVFYPTAEMCMSAAKLNFPMFIRDPAHFNVRCEAVDDKGQPR